MRKEEFCDILGEINEKYIAEAKVERKNKKSIWVKWGTMAACLALMIMCISSVIHISPFVNDDTLTDESLQSENNNHTDDSSLSENNNHTDDSSLGENNHIEILQNETEQSGNISEEQEVNIELQARIDQLSSGDSLGWIVYNEKIFMQNWNINTVSLENSNIELGECLGRAGDFLGYYSSRKNVPDGNVYLVTDHPNILCIKLDNGGTIWLGEEN